MATLVIRAGIWGASKLVKYTKSKVSPKMKENAKKRAAQIAAEEKANAKREAEAKVRICLDFEHRVCVLNGCCSIQTKKVVASAVKSSTTAFLASLDDSAQTLEDTPLTNDDAFTLDDKHKCFVHKKRKEIWAEAAGGCRIV
jgi:hypothetical protein